MEIATTSFKNWQIFAISGKFVVQSLSQVKKAFDALEKTGKTFIAIDLNLTTHLDSSAITLLVSVFKRVKEKNGNLVCFGANEDVTEVVNIVGLEGMVRFYKTRLQFEQSVDNPIS
jgi:anti-anti-sigma factor